jgi:uncharacterized membrane-anchored protein
VALNVLLFELSKWENLSFVPAISAKLFFTQLIQKEVKFIWPKELEQAFEDQKKTLTTGPILAYPDFTKTFYIILEASKTAVAVCCHCIRMEFKIP